MPESYIDRLRAELRKIESRFIDVLRSGRIEQYVQQQNPWAAFGSGKPGHPEVRFRWIDLGLQEAREQKDIIDRFQELSGEILALVEGLPHKQKTPLSSAVQKVATWIQHRSSGGVPGSIMAAISRFSLDVAEIDNLLGRMQEDIPGEISLVADTSALLDCPDIVKFATALESQGTVIVITSTVLSELDELKSSRRNNEFISRVRKAIRTIQQLKEVGDLQAGVVVADNIKVCIVPREPNFETMPEWIDPLVKDDRIIASALMIQRLNPSSNTVIVSNDLNMDLKAGTARLSTIRGPECDDA